MRAFAALAALFALWAVPASAEPVPQASCNASYEALSAADKAHVPYVEFTTTCTKFREQWVSPSPAPQNPRLAYVTGLCADNSYTTSLMRANACQQEGGVRAWFFGNYSPPSREPPPEQHLAPQPGPTPQPPRHVPKPEPQRPAPVTTPTTAAVS